MNELRVKCKVAACHYTIAMSCNCIEFFLTFSPYACRPNGLSVDKSCEVFARYLCPHTAQHPPPPSRMSLSSSTQHIRLPPIVFLAFRLVSFRPVSMLSTSLHVDRGSFSLHGRTTLVVCSSPLFGEEAPPSSPIL